ncbi:MAG: hypothetical protein PHQ66_01455 [Candidatus Nanoarchaeia archaeon]|nr:hypothetical protein [Candidatus Nanoarchaeia archaeon]MDD5357957.1 hypothetical protein [Candidatus Nanoarchaeia archaeon]MDD5588876.1 hypothetical protein [Candidatus Nanoarchaeia archaeon]
MITLNLEQLCNNYTYLLVDASAFFHRLSERVNFEDTEYKIARNNLSSEILSFWTEKIPSNPIYSTIEIKNEINHGDYKYGKSVKRNSGSKDRIVLDLRRSMKEVKVNTNRLVNTLEERERILDLNNTQKQLYNFLSDKYNPILYRNSKGDSDLLLSAGILSQKHRVCIISNDFGLLNNWKLFLYEEGIGRLRFNFYIHEEKDSFKEAVFNLNYRKN